MSKRIFLFLPIFLLTLSACRLQQPITPEFEAYIGTWSSDVFQIEIYENGGTEFNSNRTWDPSPILGRVKFKEDRIVFISEQENGGRRGLDIDQEPTTRLNSQTGMEEVYMILEGEELIRE